MREQLKKPSKSARVTLIHAGVLLGFTSLTALMTYPLVLRMTESVPGWPGDNLHYVWLLWWFKRAIVDLRTSPFFNPFVYAPEGLQMACTEMTWANTLLALPLTIRWGPVVAYNGMLLLSFILTGFATYLWVWRLTGSYAAGFVSGTVFTFSPYRMAHFPGHLPLMPTQWLPFLLYTLEELARTRRLRFAALAGLFFGLNAWASWYYFYFSLLTVPLYVLIRSGDWQRRLRSPFLWQSVALFTATALAMILPATWPFLRLYSTGEMRHTFDMMDLWAANPTDFFVPNLLHPLWGKTLRKLVPFPWKQPVEKSLFLGLIPMLLVLVSLIKRRDEKAVRALAWIALCSFILALGPTLHWLGQRIYVTVPPGAMAVLYHLGVTHYLASRLDPVLLSDMQLNHFVFIPLPMLLLYLFVPFTASMRVVARFGMITMLAFAALAGRGLAILREHWTGRYMRWALPALVVGVVLFEFLALPYEATALHPRPVDLWLAEQTDGAMAELPVADGLHPLKDYYATVHQQSMIFGPASLTFIPPVLPERSERLDSFPDTESIRALQDYETTYVVVHTDEYEDWSNEIEPWETTGQLHLARCFKALCVYKLGLSK
jgi:hypothetical protein